MNKESNDTQIPCNDTLQKESEILQGSWNVSIIVPVDGNPTIPKCLHTFEVQSSDSFISLTFNNVKDDVTIKYEREKGVTALKKVPYSNTRQVKIFANRFTLEWKRTDSSPAELVFTYQEIPRITRHDRFFKEEERSIYLSDVGGFLPNSLTNFFIQGNKDKQNHSLSLTVDNLQLDEAAGDFMIIGKGSNISTMHTSSKSIMFTRSLSKPFKILVPAKDVFVSISTIYSSVNSDNLLEFKLSYKMEGIKIIKPTSPPVATTPRSAAQQEAVSLCFFDVKEPDWSCAKFVNQTHLLKRAIAELSREYAEDKKIYQGYIGTEHVEVECYYNKKGQYNDSSEDNFITVVIINPQDADKPLLTHDQLLDFFKLNSVDISKMVESMYSVKMCEHSPNYWYWYWGTIGIFVGCLLLLLIMWCWSSNLLNKESKKEPYHAMYDAGPKDNPAFVQDEDIPGTPQAGNQGEDGENRNLIYEGQGLGHQPEPSPEAPQEAIVMNAAETSDHSTIERQEVTQL